MEITNVMRNVNALVDGVGYAGKFEKLTLPKLTIKTEEHRPGGSDAPVELDMGMEKLEASLASASIDRGLLERFGFVQNGRLPMTFRGALQSEDGTVTAAVCQLRGMIKEIDWGDWQAGEKTEMKAMMAVRYYKLEHGGAVIHEIDVENMIRIVNGVDQLAEMRAALGL